MTQPPADLSAMDGYAVRAEDVPAAPATLKLVGQSPAGGSYDHALRPGETVRIFTGAPLPMGADAIVIQEDTKAEGRTDHHPRGAAHRPPRPPGRPRLQDGRPAVRGGPHAHHARRGAGGGDEPAVALGPPEAAGGDPFRPATSSCMPGEPIGRNQIVSSSGIAVAALVRGWGGDPTLFDIAARRRGADPGPRYSARSTIS